MIEFTVPAMSCGGCVRTVTEAVHRVDAGATLKVDLPQHKVQIESARSPEEFRVALTREGYPPR